MQSSGRNDRAPSHLYAMAGWLFADLLLALAMLFLVANSVGTIRPPPSHATPTSIPTARPLPVLELKPVSLLLSVDYAALLTDDPAAIADAVLQVRQSPEIAGRRAGLVLTFGGASGASTAVALQIAQHFDTDVLQRLGQQQYVFTGTVYREFFNVNNAPTVVQVDIYLFK